MRSKSITGMSNLNTNCDSALVTAVVNKPIFTSAQPRNTIRNKGAHSDRW